jgi:hypothetical protein
VIMMELLQQCMVRLGRQQLIDHVDGGGKEHRDVGVAGGISEACGQAGCPCTRIANANDIAVGRNEVEVQQGEEPRFWVLSGFMVVEVERIDGPFFSECGLAPAQRDGLVPALLQFNVGKLMQGSAESPIRLLGLVDHGVEWLGHALEAPRGPLVLEAVECGPGVFLLITKASYSAREGSSRRIWLRWGCLRRTGGCCLWGVIS